MIISMFHSSLSYFNTNYHVFLFNANYHVIIHIILMVNSWQFVFYNLILSVITLSRKGVMRDSHWDLDVMKELMEIPVSSSMG